MKIIATITVGLLLSIKGIGQEFMGVKVGGSKASITSQLVNKGMIKTKSTNPNTLVFNGYVSDIKVELFVFFTPKTNIAWKFMVYLPKRTNWYELKEDYEKYLDLFTNKYGTPSSSYNTFLSPYYEGDGYEMSAVELDKCLYSAFWENYSVEISEYKQVRLGYENSENAKINTREKNQLNNANF